MQVKSGTLKLIRKQIRDCLLWRFNASGKNCFLTGWGMETALPFGSPWNDLPFLNPFLKNLKKELQNLKTSVF